jgi:hypothetical protein
MMLRDMFSSNSFKKLQVPSLERCPHVRDNEVGCRMSWKSSFLGSIFNRWFGLLALKLALDVTLQNLAI